MWIEIVYNTLYHSDVHFGCFFFTLQVDSVCV